MHHQMNPVRVKRFVKHVIKAAQKKQEKHKARKSLSQQVEKIKGMKGPLKKEILGRELKKLERKLSAVLIDESTPSSSVHSFKSDLARVESKIDSLHKKDVRLLSELMNQVISLDRDLHITEEALEKETQEKTFQINNINTALVDVRARVKKVKEDESERERKFAEIERKIKEKVGKNYDEIVKLEKHLDNLEELYDKLKKSGISSMKQKKFDSRIEVVKKRLIMKRAGVDDTKFIPTIRKTPEKKSFLFKKKSIPLKKKSFIKHSMHLKPSHEFHEPIISGKLPPLPPLPPMPQPPKEKEGFMSHFFHNKTDEEKSLDDAKEKLKSFRKQLHHMHKEPSFFDKIKNMFRKKPLDQPPLSDHI